MTLWQKLALAFVAIVLLFAGIVAMQPATFSIQRTLRIAAPPAVVAAQIENLRAMDVWSPWAHMDPELEIQYEGPEAGVGARSSWEGPQMGKGRLTVTAVQPEQIEMIYWFADFPNEPARFEYNAAQYQRDWDWLTRLSEEIDTASNYPPTEDRQKCVFCTYRSYCERGIRAGAWEDVETESQAEENFDVNFEQVGEIAF
jgi:hypothetical protein